MAKNVEKLTSACLRGDIPTAEHLISTGVSVNSLNTDGFSPLYSAAQNGHRETVQLLLQNGASVNQAQTTRGCTPLFQASQNGHRETVQLLLQNGASVNQAKTDTGSTPLFMASQNGHRETVQLLLQNGASVNQAQTTTGATPLYVASQNGHRETVQLVLQNGASVNQAETDTGSTPLFMSSQNGHRETVQLLLQNGASVNQAQTTTGATPLFMASQEGHRETVQLLLEHGASVNQYESWRYGTPLRAARIQGHTAVVELLKQHTASVKKAKKLLASGTDKEGNIIPGEATTVKQKIKAFFGKGNSTSQKVEVRKDTQEGEKLVNQPKAPDSKRDNGDKNAALHHQEKTETITRKLELSKSVGSFLSSGQTQKRFIADFSKQGIMVKFHTVSDIQVSLTATNEAEWLKAEEIIRSVVDEKIIQMHISNTESLESDRWNTLCGAIKRDYEAELIIAVNDITRAIHVAGLKDVIPAVVQTIQRFLAREQFDKKQGSPFFHQGDATTWKWTEAEKKMLTETSAMRVLYVGETEAGKSSLVRTILSGDSYLAHIDDRTVIAELNHWVVRDQKNDKCTFSLVDLGGHQSYLSSGHFFHCNSRNNIATLCHDIMSKDYYKSFMWLKSVLTRSPKCHIAISLTKSDLLSEQEQQAKLKLFRDKLKVHLQKEIESLEYSIWLAENSDFTKLSTFIELREKYELIIREMEEITVLVSCKKGYEESVGALTDMYVQLSEKPENKIILPVHFHTVFSRSGNVGMQIIDVETTPQPVSGSHDAFNDGVLADSRTDAIDVIQEEIISNFEGDQTASELPLKVNTLQQQIPIVLEKTTEQKVSQHMTLDEAMEVYTEALVHHHLPESIDLKADTQRCLTCLHQHGLMMYFPVAGQLENIVFNNINTFVVIMRCVFHHNLPQYLETFCKIPGQFRFKFYENDEQKYKEDVELLHSQGLLSVNLLTILLHKSECQIAPEAVLELLDLLEIGFSFVPEGMCTKYMFIPYFVEDKTLSEEIELEITQFEKSDHKSLSIHSQVRGNLSVTLWHYLLVRFCKKLIHKNMQRREIWSDGLLAYVGESDAMLLLLFNGEDKIDLRVKGNVTTSTGHETIWQYIRFLSSEIGDLMRDWWPGLVTSKILFCTHCTIMCQQKTTENCYEWPLDQILDSKSCWNDTCCCKQESGKQIPSALLMPLPLDATKAQVRVTALCDYLSETFAKSPENTELAAPQHALTQQTLLSQQMWQEKTMMNFLKQEKVLDPKFSAIDADKQTELLDAVQRVLMSVEDSPMSAEMFKEKLHELKTLFTRELHTISDKSDRALIESVQVKIDATATMAKNVQEQTPEQSLHKKLNELEHRLTQHITDQMAKLGVYDDTYDFNNSLIRHNYEALVTGIYPDDIIDYLYQEATLSFEDYERVGAQLTTRDKNRLILIKVDARGQDGISRLCVALSATPQAYLTSLLISK